MIKGIIIVNNNGQARICKFFQSVHEEGYSAEDAQQQVVRKVFQQVAQRPDSFCNYLEGSIGAGRGSPSRRGGVVAESTVRLVVRTSISTRMWEKVRGHGVELKLDPGSRAG